MKRRPRIPLETAVHIYLKDRPGFRKMAKALKYSLTRWHEIDPTDAPDVPCCYAMYLGERLVYIGSTERLRARFAKHFFLHPELATAIRLKVRFPRCYGEWRMTEERLIRRLSPPWNKRGVKTKRVEAM